MLGETQAAVRPSKPKTVRQSHVNATLLGLFGGIVAIESISHPLQIDGRRHHILDSALAVSDDSGRAAYLVDRENGK